jgi:hypothetical protein
MKLSHKFGGLFLLTLGFSNPFCFAQQATPAGVVAIATNATLGSTTVSEGATVFSGDVLKTGDGGRLQVQSGALQFVLGANSAARIFRADNRFLVELERGALAYTAKGGGEDLTLYALDVKFLPKTTLPAAGQITIVSRCNLTATSTHSSIEVTSGRETRTVEESKSFRILSAVGVDYRDSWKPVLSDYPEYPRDAEYHHSHDHIACAADLTQQAHKAPISALGAGHFGEIVGGGVTIIGVIGVIKAFESPDRP